MSKHNHHHPRKIYIPDVKPGETIPVTMVPAELIAASETKALPREPFHAEDMTFSPQSGTPSIVLLNAYLNDFRKANPDADLLQMIPTGSNCYLFVWEL